ncbi:Re/Si-specific NAD(P)(+) transhydrogenase subunit alpha [Candidatus Viridilinea mediisalina]|uniref:NAD(P) transhydrogenase subunit alpha part 1 n=1 Tax=Candidatus Viridilinea mediisalina TaxID=2024553 RepID=A0A2A6RL79_9CHLR|nr:Re/Si-specific NAD(P)(+) transhydrogenase subunit alpha [Candidatus Viridilinea mediisalina]PDW03661.1 NAD(P)(+) transhydrogenase (Re/Si-specific) subunit alpha [Candidatus Viridilinea mediisalina]
MIVGVPRETAPGEQRVALVPNDVSFLQKLGLEVQIEAGAGVAAGFPDAFYVERGVTVAASRQGLFAAADMLFQVRATGAAQGDADLALLRSGQLVIGFLDPFWQPQWIAALAQRGVNAIALELVPRISRAQSMDALSSMATIVGYKATLLAAMHLPRIFPMLMTAAGTITPARIFVIGAGVAGLQACAQAKRMGARVEAYDVRVAVKEQVESVGAKFVELPLETGDSEDKGGYAKAQGEDFYRRQRQLMGEVVARNDVVITTAAIPGKRSPVLVTGEMVQGMQPGSVVVDLAAEHGGNCELTRADELVQVHGVTILGPTNLAATVPNHASQLYSRNLINIIRLAVKDGKLNLTTDDEIIRESMVAHAGEVCNARVQELLEAKSAVTTS